LHDDCLRNKERCPSDGYAKQTQGASQLGHDFDRKIILKQTQFIVELEIQLTALFSHDIRSQEIQDGKIVKGMFPPHLEGL